MSLSSTVGTTVCARFLVAQIDLHSHPLTISLHGQELMLFWIGLEHLLVLEWVRVRINMQITGTLKAEKRDPQGRDGPTDVLSYLYLVENLVTLCSKVRICIAFCL